MALDRPEQPEPRRPSPEQRNAILGEGGYKTTYPRWANTTQFNNETHYYSPFCWCHPRVSARRDGEGRAIDIDVSHQTGSAN